MPANDPLLSVLKRFAHTVANRFDVSDVLYELSDHTVQVLNAAAAGVSVVDQHGMLRFAAASTDTAVELERLQEELHDGPCQQAFATRQVVLIEDVTRHEGWPHYAAKAKSVGFKAVAGIPLIAGDNCLGAINVFDTAPRAWTANDVAVAGVLADIATSYLLHASQLEQAKRLNEQLQHALDARVIIEQAKGIIAGERAISIEQSLQLLRHHARSNNVTLHEIAEAVVRLGLRPDHNTPARKQRNGT